MNFLSKLLGRSHIRLSQRLGAYPLENGDIGPLQVLFGVENRGREPVEITSVHVASKDGEQFPVKLTGEVPTMLRPGGDIRYEVRAKTLAEAARAAGYNGTPTLSFVVTDGEGDGHRHDFELRVDEYLALKDE